MKLPYIEGGRGGSLFLTETEVPTVYMKVPFRHPLAVNPVAYISIFGKVYLIYCGQLVPCNLNVFTESDAANQGESNALFFKILLIFLGGGQIFEVPIPIFLKLRNRLIEISSLGSIIHV